MDCYAGADDEFHEFADYTCQRNGLIIIPWTRKLWKSLVDIAAIFPAFSFKTFADISSGPAALCTSRLPSNLATPTLSIVIDAFLHVNALHVVFNVRY